MRTGCFFTSILVLNGGLVSCARHYAWNRSDYTLGRHGRESAKPTSQIYTARFWYGEQPDENPFVAPELHCGDHLCANQFTKEGALAKQMSGIALSGGGTRAYILGMAYLRGLFMMDLIPHSNLRYLSTSSGSAWAGGAFVYFQGTDLRQWLHVPSSNFNDNNSVSKLLHHHSEHGWNRHIPCLEKLSKQRSHFLRSSMTAMDWKYFSHSMFLKRARISKTDVMAINAEHKAYLEAKLGPEIKVILPILPGMPMLTITLVVITGRDLVRDKYSIIPVKSPPCPPLTVAPVYTGSLLTGNYTFNSMISNRSVTMMIGGLVETFSFGMDFESVLRNVEGNRTALVKTPSRRTRPFSMADAIAATTAAPMVTFLKNKPAAIFKTALARRAFGIRAFKEHYWSPAALRSDDRKHMNKAVFLGDGGSVENIPILEQIVRGVRCILAISMPDVDIDTNFEWADPDSPIGVKLLSQGNKPIGEDIASFFGLTAKLSDPSFELRHNHVFPEREWLPLVREMQDKRRKDKFVIVTRDHITVQNDHWGIKANQNVRITWVYSSPDINFPLFSDLEAKRNYSDAVGTDLRKAWDKFFGQKATFPLANLYKSTMNSIPPRIANAMHAYGTWAMLEYRDILKEAIQCQTSDDNVVVNQASISARRAKACPGDDCPVAQTQPLVFDTEKKLHDSANSNACWLSCFFILSLVVIIF